MLDYKLIKMDKTCFQTIPRKDKSINTSEYCDISLAICVLCSVYTRYWSMKNMVENQPKGRKKYTSQQLFYMHGKVIFITQVSHRVHKLQQLFAMPRVKMIFILYRKMVIIG